jgi:hypothetical protein
LRGGRRRRRRRRVIMMMMMTIVIVITCHQDEVREALVEFVLHGMKPDLMPDLMDLMR